MDSALRPRDIQARIRAGESPEDVAAAAQTSVEAIMAFANPVLAERAHVARTALKASVRRRVEASGSGRTLADSAEIYFGDHALHDDDVAWDSWRQADGRWALVASFDVDGRARRAEFTHDLPGKYVVAENDDARLLTGELAEPGTPAPGVRRLTAVSAADDLPLGDDAIELVRDRAPEPSSSPDDTAPLTAPVTAPATESVADPVAEENESVEVEEPFETPRPSAPQEPPAGDQPLFEDEQEAAAEPPEPTSEPTSGPTSGPTSEPAPAAAKAARPKRKGRSAIPSWDEIMFGDSKTD